MNTAPRATERLELAGARVVVVGAARSGLAAARFLLDRGATVVLTDVRAADALGPEVAALGRDGAVLELGGHDTKSLLSADLVALSPGVPRSAPPVAAALQQGIRVVAEVELAAWFLKGIVIGITGTNGKSTTTALAAHLLRQAGLEATACGNYGTPLTAMVAADAADRYYVVELSSFQLESIETFRPWITVLLNLSPDHQDRYPDARAYYHAKRRIFDNQGPADHAILNRDDPEVRALEAGVRARVHHFSGTVELPDGAFVREGAIVLRRRGRDIGALPVASLPVRGAHNVDNVMAALLIADLCGVPMPKAERSIGGFRGLPHRLEKVRDLEGAAWYNDSKATNIGATMKSLLSFPAPVVLILGGRDKGGNFRALRPLIEQRVAHLVLMGEAREAIAAALGAVAPVTLVRDMAGAVEAARAAAAPGSVVLLAPACASFDQYADYEQRGDDFRRRVLALGGAAPAAGPAPAGTR